jgi:hypothetical protein
MKLRTGITAMEVGLMIVCFTVKWMLSELLKTSHTFMTNSLALKKESKVQYL